MIYYGIPVFILAMKNFYLSYPLLSPPLNPCSEESLSTYLTSYGIPPFPLIYEESLSFIQAMESPLST
jgi:hypothetical protein